MAEVIFVPDRFIFGFPIKITESDNSTVWARAVLGRYIHHPTSLIELCQHILLEKLKLMLS